MTETTPAWAATTQPQPQPTPPATRPSRARRILTHSAVGILAFIIGVGVGGTSPEDTDTTTQKPTPERQQQPPANDKPQNDTPEPADAPEDETPDGTIPGSGVYLVGDDIKPGTYRTTGPDGPLCYWARLSSTSGEFDAIIANGNPDGPSVVTIEASDAAFETTGCADWTPAE